LQKAGADAGESAVKGIQDLWKAGLLTDYTRVAQLELNQVVLEDTLAQAEGEIALGLIQVYRALGGGWQIRCNGCSEPPITPQCAAPTPEPAAPQNAPPTTKAATPQSAPPIATAATLANPSPIPEDVNVHQARFVPFEASHWTGGPK
jgi:hypothetical protein